MISACTLPACSILPEREPTQVYEPTFGSAPADPSWPTANWSLIVAKPNASQMLGSDRITVRPSPGAVQVYKSASWTDPVPDMLQTALIRRFEDSAKILSVARPGSGVSGEYQLMTEIRSFDSVYVGGGPQAVIDVYAKLVHTSDGNVVAARSFRESEPAAGTGVEAVVDAFSRALDRTTTQLVGWTLAGGNRHEAGPETHD
jgi:cholesterol transport system auxiliary component